MKKLCKACNYTNVDGAIFCANCGERIDEEFDYNLLGLIFFMTIVLIGFSLISLH